MRVIVQRVSNSQVKIDGDIYNEINSGFLLLVGITESDTKEIALKMASKISKLRIFDDNEGKMNLSIKDVGGSILSISQFTLYASCVKGNRPSFDLAAKGEIAKPLYEFFNECLANEGLIVKPGIFGADMKVELLNDGPVTIILDSKELF